MDNVLIVGIGNFWRGDDSIGPKIITWLKENVARNDYLIVTDLFSLLDIGEKYQQVVIIDAVNMGEPPGTVKAFNPEEVKLLLKSNTSSTHGFGLAEIIKLAESLRLEINWRIIGIQAGDVLLGNELSLALQNQWEVIVNQVKQKIFSY